MEETKLPAHKYNEQKKIGKIISGEVKVKEKSFGRKLADIFLSEDAKNVKSYLVTEVVIPAIQDTIADIVKSGVDMLFYGRNGKTSSKKNGGTYVSYSNYYNPSPRGRKADTGDRNRNRSNSREFVFRSNGEANDVLDTLFEITKDYQAASVADLCSLVGITPEWNDYSWGWYDLSGSTVKRVHGGYILDLPKPIYLE